MCRHRRALQKPTKPRTRVRKPRKPRRNQLTLNQSRPAKIPRLPFHLDKSSAYQSPLSEFRKESWLRPKLVTTQSFWGGCPTRRSMLGGNTGKIAKAKSSALSFPTAAAIESFQSVMTSERTYFSPGISNFALTTGLAKIFSCLSRIGLRLETSNLD